VLLGATAQGGAIASSMMLTCAPCSSQPLTGALLVSALLVRQPAQPHHQPDRAPATVSRLGEVLWLPAWSDLTTPGLAHPKCQAKCKHCQQNGGAVLMPGRCSDGQPASQPASQPEPASALRACTWQAALACLSPASSHTSWCIGRQPSQSECPSSPC